MSKLRLSLTTWLLTSDHRVSAGRTDISDRSIRVQTDTYDRCQARQFFDPDHPSSVLRPEGSGPSPLCLASPARARSDTNSTQRFVLFLTVVNAFQHAGITDLDWVPSLYIEVGSREYEVSAEMTEFTERVRCQGQTLR